MRRAVHYNRVIWRKGLRVENVLEPWAEYEWDVLQAGMKQLASPGSVHGGVTFRCTAISPKRRVAYDGERSTLRWRLRINRTWAAPRSGDALEGGNRNPLEGGFPKFAEFKHRDLQAEGSMKRSAVLMIDAILTLAP